MKILMVGKFPMDPRFFKEGTEGSVYGEARALVQRGHEVVVLDMPRSIIEQDYQETVDGVQVYRFFCEKETPKFQRKVVRHRIIPKLLSMSPDICHLHVKQHHSPLIIAALRLHKIKFLVEIHGLPRNEAKQAFLKQRSITKFFSWMHECYREFVFVRQIRLVVTDTDYEKAALEKYAISHPIDVSVIHQGIHEDFYHQDYQPQPNTILAVGTIAPRKDQLMMLDVIDRVRKEIPDVKLAIVGALVDLEYYKKLQVRIVSKKLSQHVTLHPDVHASELLKKYSRSRLFILSASEESQCVAMAEAMAVGLPVVSTKVGGIVHLISDGKNGYLCAHGDVKTMARQIVSLLRDDETCQRMSLQNRQDAEEYRWDTLVDKYIALYDRILNEK